jgi:hypothetical protein
VKYLIMIHSNPQFQERWNALSDDERAQFGRGHFALSDALAASGELIASEGLTDPVQRKWVQSRNGATTVSADGPFAEVKEHLAGFYLIDCESEERALAIAAQVPDAVWGLVEVRPVLDMSGWDM